MNLKSWVLPAVCLVVTLGAGAAQGLFVSRWTSSSNMQAAADALSNLPLRFGDWEAERYDLGESERQQTGTRGWYTVRLRNTVDQREASLMLLCGQTRPLSVHPPTVCFQGMGLELSGATEKIRVRRADGGGTWGEFMHGDFVPSEEATGNSLRTYWAWSRDGRKWEAPEIPRFSFSGAPYLYKIYVTRRLDSPDRGAQRDKSPAKSEQKPRADGSSTNPETCELVLQDFLTELQSSIPSKN